MIYELRTYTVFPDKMQKLLNLWETIGKPVIDRHMECVLVTTSESGALNQIIHLYQYLKYQVLHHEKILKYYKRTCMK